MSLEFPFEYADIVSLGRLFYPIIKAKLKTTKGWLEFDFLVDTGADITTIPSHILPVLGLHKSNLSQNTTIGVGGIEVMTWEFRLPIRLGKEELNVYCSAVETHNDSMPLLLGRKDIFENKFNLFLDSKKKMTVISKNFSRDLRKSVVLSKVDGLEPNFASVIFLIP